jgi:hypothetical protein
VGNDDRKAAVHGRYPPGSHTPDGRSRLRAYLGRRWLFTEEMHRWLRRWLADAGQTAYGDSRGVAADTRAPLASGSPAVGAQP